MKFKLNAVASACLLGSLLGCAPLTPVAPLTGSAAAPSRAQTSAVPVRVAQAPVITAAMPSSDALYTQGLAAHGAGLLTLASQRYVQALKIAPTHLGALNALAVIYAQTDRTDEALKLFAYAVELAPASAHIRNNNGYALLRAGRLDEAEIALNKARELDPNNAQTQQNLALLATARATQAAAAPAVQADVAAADAGVESGPRLVAVAPGVFEFQVPPSGNGSAGTSAVAAAPVQQAAASITDKRLTPPSAISTEFMPRLAAMPANIAASDELRGVRLEVSNGVGITRLARRTADRLATEGVKTARLTNAKPYRQVKTEIQYLANQIQAVQALQSRLPVATLAVPAKHLNAGVQVRLVLGRDIAGQAITAWLDGVATPQVAAKQQGGGWRWS